MNTRQCSTNRNAGTLRQGGFTLVEVITVIAVLCILASLAVPAMGGFLRNSQLRSASFDVRAILVRARSEAINRNTEVHLVPSSANWRNGWTLRTAAGSIIESRAGLGNVTASPASAPTVVFGVDGRVRSGSQVIVLSAAGDGQDAHPRCITLNASGRASTRLDSDFDATNGCG
jgi:type IV fimbrial biogenesis protein FimT